VIKLLKWLTLRTVNIFIVTIFFLTSIYSLKEVVKESRLTALNRLRPESFHTVFKAFNNEQFDPKELIPLRLYFKNVGLILPLRSDALGLKGFCSYHMGDYNDAIRSYQKAIDINSGFFWYHYNLGVIHYKLGDFEKAEKSFLNALDAPPSIVPIFVESSFRLYKPFTGMLGMPDANALLGQVKVGVRDVYTLLIMSAWQRERYDNVLLYAQKAFKSNLDDDGFFLFYAGLGAYHTEKYMKTITIMQRYLNQYPNQPEAQRTMALSLKAVGKGQFAIPIMIQSEVNKGKSIDYQKSIDEINIKLY